MSDRLARQASCQLRLHCPRCGASVLVAWNRLRGVLFCRGCRSWYEIRSGRLAQVEPPAKLRVAVRSYMSAWQSDEVELAPGASLGQSLAGCLFWLFRDHAGMPRWTRVAIAGAGLTLAVVAGGLAWRFAPPPATLPLPTALEERIALLAEAWLAGDLKQMLRLTDASRDRLLRRWLAIHVPPEAAAHGQPRPAAMELVAVKRRARNAEVTLRLPRAGKRVAGRPMLLQQRWVERQGAWYFLPETAGGGEGGAR